MVQLTAGKAAAFPGQSARLKKVKITFVHKVDLKFWQQPLGLQKPGFLFRELRALAFYRATTLIIGSKCEPGQKTAKVLFSRLRDKHENVALNCYQKVRLILPISESHLAFSAFSRKLHREERKSIFSHQQ